MSIKLAETEKRMAEAKTYYETQKAKLAEASKHIKARCDPEPAYQVSN